MAKEFWDAIDRLVSAAGHVTKHYGTPNAVLAHLKKAVDELNQTELKSERDQERRARCHAAIAALDRKDSESL